MSGNPLGTAGIVAHDAIVELCAGHLPPLELLEEVARHVRAVIPYAAAGWLQTDPATLLHTGAVSEGVPQDLHLQLIENEIATEDVAKFSDVARLRRPVLALSEATGGWLERSARYRDLYAPRGYGDELRVAFRARDVCWGVGCLTRLDDDQPFNDAEVEFMAAVAHHVAHGLRNALLIERCEDSPELDKAAGMVVLHNDGTVESLTGEAERWLRQLPTDGLELPAVVLEVARQTRAHAEHGVSGAPARARVRLTSGRWLILHGTRLLARGPGPARTAVVLEPARRADLAPLIFELYELTEREREVTQLLISGRATGEIARALRVSHHTVRDHVKAIFAKVGVTSRPELTARLVHEDFLPDVLHAGRVRTSQ